MKQSKLPNKIAYILYIMLNVICFFRYVIISIWYKKMLIVEKVNFLSSLTLRPFLVNLILKLKLLLDNSKTDFLIFCDNFRCLNAEGISYAKYQYLQKKMTEDLVAVQETHSENENQSKSRGKIAGYELIGSPTIEHPE